MGIMMPKGKARAQLPQISVPEKDGFGSEVGRWLMEESLAAGVPLGKLLRIAIQSN